MIKRKKKSMTTPITYYGGKQRMVRHILPLIPKHNLYCEPFVGGGAVFWAKPKSNVEVINDLNGHVTTFYTVCQREFGMLRRMIIGTPHSRKAHREAYQILEHPEAFSSLSRAWAFWCQTTQGFAGQLGRSWGYEKLKVSTSRKIHNKRIQFNKALQHRLDLVQIECNDAIRVIQTRDTPESFFYIDPPYYNSDCGHYGGYTLENFTALLDVLSGIKGKFLLSSYPSDVLSEYAKRHGWRQRGFQSTVSVTYQTDKVKTEMLTANYSI